MKLSAAVAGLLLWGLLPALAQQSGAARYAQHCAKCHDGGDQPSRVPSRGALQLMSFEHVLRIITSGSMAPMAEGRTDDELKAIASFATGRITNDFTSAAASNTSVECVKRTPTPAVDLDRPQWNGWGEDLNNGRFQPAEAARLTLGQVPQLQLKWAFGFPSVPSANAQPSVVGGVLFVGGGDFKVQALDAMSGCTIRTYATEAPVRAAISFGPLPGTDQFAVFL
jgi:polyvinyl alcohol dehydrogenase (cytochrome)